jgi:hypothetical protein
VLLTVGIIVLVLALSVGVLAIWWFHLPTYQACAQIEIVTKDAAKKDEPRPKNI